MSVPSRRSPVRRIALVALPLLALVLGLLAGPAVVPGAVPGAEAARRKAPAVEPREESVLEGLAFLQRRVGPHTHLVTGAARTVKVREATGRKHGRARWVRRTLPAPVYPGASIDVLMALRRLDPRGATQKEIARALQASSARLVQWRVGALRGRYAGATARMLYVAATSGTPVNRYGDGSLRRSLARMVLKQKGSPMRGRVMDSGWGGDTSDTVSQAAAVQALAAIDSKYLPMAARFLAKQACTGGHFRLLMDSPDYTCKNSLEVRNRVYDVDATSLAILALVTARAHGVKHLDDEISAASAWLARRVRPSGGVADHHVITARTTGLAALALRASGRPGAAGNAAGWLLRQQVDQRVVQRYPALRGLRGAIAWDRATLRSAKRDGVPDRQLKRWVVWTAAAAPGLTALLPERTLGIHGANRGDRLVVNLSGLVVGERYVLERNGRTVDAGRAGADGTAHVVLRRATGKVRLQVVGSRATRSGVTVVSTR